MTMYMEDHCTALARYGAMYIGIVMLVQARSEWTARAMRVRVSVHCRGSGTAVIATGRRCTSLSPTAAGQTRLSLAPYTGAVVCSHTRHRAALHRPAL